MQSGTLDDWQISEGIGMNVSVYLPNMNEK